MQRSLENLPVIPDDKSVGVNDEEVRHVRVGLQGSVQHYGPHPGNKLINAGYLVMGLL
jgi:hypothetical protein